MLKEKHTQGGNVHRKVSFRRRVCLYIIDILLPFGLCLQLEHGDVIVICQTYFVVFWGPAQYHSTHM